MLKVKKTVLVLGIASCLITSANAAGVAGWVSDVASSIAADTIKKLFQKDGEIDISNSNFKNTVNIDDSTVVMSNVGIEIIGKEIKIDNSNFTNDVKAMNSDVYFSNLGISLNSGEIKINNSNFTNEVSANNALLVGSNAGIKFSGK